MVGGRERRPVTLTPKGRLRRTCHVPYAAELAFIPSLGAAVASSGGHRLQRQRLLTAVAADRDRHLLTGGQTELDADEVIGVAHLLASDVDEDITPLDTRLVAGPPLVTAWTRTGPPAEACIAGGTAMTCMPSVVWATRPFSAS